MTVKATAACLLEGQYAALYTGYVSGQAAVGGTAMNVSSTGTISGFHDFNPGGTPISETLSGTCATRTANNGTVAAHRCRQLTGLQLCNDHATAQWAGATDQWRQHPVRLGTIGKADSSGLRTAKLAGNFAFGALGGQPGAPARAGRRYYNGRGGHVTSGHADSNSDSPSPMRPSAEPLPRPTPLPVAVP